MSFRTARMSIIAIFLALLAANAQATIIDSFDAADQWLSVSYRAKFQFASENVPPSTAIADRDVWIQWLSGAASSSEIVVDPTVGTGFFFTQGGEAKTTIVWDGDSTTHNIGYSLNESLTSGGADRFLLDVADVTGVSMNLKITVYKDSGHAWAYQGVLPVGTTGMVPILYKDFQHVISNDPYDFSNVGAIVVELGGPGCSSSNVGIRSMETAVPEPSSLGLAAIGVAAFFGVRKRFPKA